MSALARAWLLTLLSLLAHPAGAVDLEAMKRLARIDASAEAQKEAADQPAKTATDRVLSGSASQMEKLARGIEAAHAAAPNKW